MFTRKLLRNLFALQAAVLLVISNTNIPVVFAAEPPTGVTIDKNSKEETTTGDIDVSGQENSDGIRVTIASPDSNIEEYKATTGNIKANHAGVAIEIDNGTKVNVSSGTINADYGIYIDETNRGSAAAVTTGDITSDEQGIDIDDVKDHGTVALTTKDIKSGDDGVYIEDVDNNSAVTVTTGNIASGEDGIEVNGVHNSTADITTENITSDDYGIYINAIDNSSAANITTGDITSRDDGINAVDVFDSAVTIKTKNITSENGDGAELASWQNATVNLYVDENLTGKEYDGLLIWTDSADGMPGGKINVIVEGTISGKGNGISLYEGSSEYELINEEAVNNDLLDKIDITAWKIEAGEGKISTSDKLAERINYIIKVAESTGAKLSALNADGKPLDTRSYEDFEGNTKTFNVAKETEKVILKITPDPGYKVIAVYNGDGEKVKLEQDENGNYYIVTPRGGGVYLSVEVEKENKPEETKRKAVDTSVKG